MSEPVRVLTQLIWPTVVTALLVAAQATPSAADPQSRRQEWPATDFTRHALPFADIKSGGPPKDGILAIDSPRFGQLHAGRASGWSRMLQITNLLSHLPLLVIREFMSRPSIAGPLFCSFLTSPNPHLRCVHGSDNRRAGIPVPPRRIFVNVTGREERRPRSRPIARVL